MINAANENNVRAVLLMTCRTASGTNLQISNEFNIVFLVPKDSEGAQMLQGQSQLQISKHLNAAFTKHKK